MASALALRYSSIELWRPHPRRPRGDVRPGEKARRTFSSMGGKAPGYRLSPDHFQTVKQMLASYWAQKMLCIIVPNRRTASPEFFLWVRTWWLLTCLAHAPKKCTQSGNFQFDINSPFQNTVYPKTKDAFPKIQAWAYNRYSRLHRSRLRKYREFNMARQLTTTKTSHEEWTHIFSVSIVIIPTHLLCQMQANSSGAEFLSTIFKFIKRKKILSLLVYVLLKTWN